MYINFMYKPFTPPHIDVSKNGADESSSSSETSPTTTSTAGNRKPYLTRKGKTKSAPLGKRHVRSSSGYSSHNDETTFSISHAPSFNDRIHPPTRFSDLPLSDMDLEKAHKMAAARNTTAGLTKLNREAFQINVWISPSSFISSIDHLLQFSRNFSSTFVVVLSEVMVCAVCQFSSKYSIYNNY